MTEVETATHDPSIRRRRMARGLARGARTTLGPLWVTTFRDPVRTGRLRLDGLSGPERLLARSGLVAMVLLLGSLLFGDLWRRGDLLPLTILADPLFVPDGLVPVTLVALFLALALIVWGALDASPGVRVTVAGLYLGTVSILGVPAVVEVSDSWWLTQGDLMLRIGFWTPCGALVLSAALSLLPARIRARLGWTTAVLRALSLLGFAAMAVAHLGMETAFSDAGFRGNVQSLIHSAFTGIDGLLIPLVFITAVAIVDFATDVSTSLAEPVRSAQARLLRWLKAALLAVILVKLWFAVVRHFDYWSTVLAHQPVAVVRTLLVLGLMAGVSAYVLRSTPAGTDTHVDEVKERLTMTGSFVLSAAVLGALVVVGLGQLIFTVTEDAWAVEYSDDYPVDTLSDAIPIVASVLCLGFGIWLLRTGSARLGPQRSRELGSGLLILGAWNLPAWIDAATELSWGFSYPTIDVGVTLVALGWLLVRWRRVDTGEVSLLLAVVVFSWLVISRGDYLSFLGGLLGLPGVVVVVFGVLYTLLSGSGFTTESSKRLPRESRTLMFVGYLLLSVTILNWHEVIHDPQSPLFATSAFYFLGLPLAIWLLIRRVVPRQLAPAGARDV
ncbi:hypothetical protein [Nocardioides dilutus]